MSFYNNASAPRRNNPFQKPGTSSPASTPNGRPVSALYGSPATPAGASSFHNRSQSNGTPGQANLSAHNTPKHGRRDSKPVTPMSNTFAPAFIKTEASARDVEAVSGIEGENDFSGKRYVWLKDPEQAFVRGWVVEELAGNQLLVQADDGTVSAGSLSLPLPC